MVVKGELSLSDLQKITGEIRTGFLRNGQNNRLGHLEIAALLFKLNPARVVWSSSFSKTALHKLYYKIGNLDAGRFSCCPIIRRPHSALGFAAGLAFEASLRGGKSHTCCCLSDVDQFLGGVWEAAVRAFKLGLGNLVLFVVESGNGTELVADRYASCGWNVFFMNAADLAGGLRLLTVLKAEDIPSVIITKAVQEETNSRTVSSYLRADMSSTPAGASLHEQIIGLLRGIDAVPGEFKKAVFLVTDRGVPRCFAEKYGNAGRVRFVDCGPAGATAFSLARGFREAGGASFVAYCDNRGFSLSGSFRGARYKEKIEYPRSVQEAENAVLRLWNLAVPWQIRIRICR